MLNFVFEEPKDVGVWGNVVDSGEGEEDAIWCGARRSQDGGKKLSLMSPQVAQILSGL